MVMVPWSAFAIERLAVVGADCVDLAGLEHHLQRAIDRGQADLVAARAQVVVELASADKRF